MLAQVLVFSYSAKMLDFIQAMTDLAGYSSCRLDGSTPQKDRQVGISCWKHKESCPQFGQPLFA